MGYESDPLLVQPVAQPERQSSFQVATAFILTFATYASYHCLRTTYAGIKSSLEVGI